MLQNRGFATHAAALEAVARAIGEYNGYRPHASLDFLTPGRVHSSAAAALKKRWRKRPPYESRLEKKLETTTTTTTTNPNAAEGGVQGPEQPKNPNFFQPFLRQPISG